MSRQQQTGHLRQIAPSAAPTNPHNYERLRKKNPVAGQKQSDLHKEICRIVNNKHNTSWTPEQVKAKMAYVKRKYRDAVELNSTGEGPVLQKQEAICPLFLRLHTVLGGNLSANPPPPRQSGSKGEDLVTSDDSEEESSDLEPLEDTSDTAFHAETATSGFHGTLHPGKRRKVETLTFAILNSTVDKMHQLADKQIDASDRLRAEFRARELAILAAERAEFKKEIAAERAELRQDRAQFMKERDELKAENSALKKELEIRLKP
ncbi:hypothetical protein BKA57DRAFT_507421 [Linnemannia elongata]|nr:hypothetical protein BKA57DRAFT_507421 [Linnemannia elongata]